MSRPLMVSCIALLLLTATGLKPQPPIDTSTHVDIRVISKGAKFIGTSMGGVEIVIRDAHTGDILAQGITRGGTGDTEKIMKAKQTKHEPVSTEGAAVYQTFLHLVGPRKIEVTARGPLGQPQAENRVSVTQWVVPQKHLTGGDGLVLELPGFAVDVLSPPAHKKVSTTDSRIEVRANVTMLCGCPIEPDGLWDADQIEVSAIVKKNGLQFRPFDLQYAGETSQFSGQLKPNGPGAYEICVFAYDPENGNTGLDKTTVIVE